MSRARAAGVLLWACLALVAAVPARPVDVTPPLPSAQLQQRYVRLTHELRCMQCQSESLADSQVDLAADLRRQVHDLLLAGDSDDQIRDYMVARYGEFILFRPRMSWRNAWLWGAPVFMMLVGVLVAWRVLRSRSRLADVEDAGADDAAGLP
ncbi:MAG TPA: cytochrome c-type biogenesis protein [Steroidobacteraceae bacterium]|jgi:cytochrome c-type biogenesis protein CcmH